MYYDILLIVMDRDHFDPQDIDNVDVTGVMTVQKPGITKRGTRQLGAFTSVEYDTLVTLAFAALGISSNIHICVSITKNISPELD